MMPPKMPVQACCKQAEANFTDVTWQGRDGHGKSQCTNQGKTRTTVSDLVQTRNNISFGDGLSCWISLPASPFSEVIIPGILSNTLLHHEFR